MDTFWELLLALSALIFIVGSCFLHSNALRFMEIADKLFALTDQRMSLLEDQVDDLRDRLQALEHPPLSRDGNAVAYVSPKPEKCDTISERNPKVVLHSFDPRYAPIVAEQERLANGRKGARLVDAIQSVLQDVAEGESNDKA